MPIQATHERPSIEHKNFTIGYTGHFCAKNPTDGILFREAEIRVFAHEEKVERKYAKYGALFEGTSALIMLVSSLKFELQNTNKEAAENWPFPAAQAIRMSEGRKNHPRKPLILCTHFPPFLSSLLGNLSKLLEKTSKLRRNGRKWLLIFKRLERQKKQGRKPDTIARKKLIKI